MTQGPEEEAAGELVLLVDAGKEGPDTPAGNAGSRIDSEEGPEDRVDLVVVEAGAVVAVGEEGPEEEGDAVAVEVATDVAGEGEQGGEADGAVGEKGKGELGVFSVPVEGEENLVAADVAGAALEPEGEEEAVEVLDAAALLASLVEDWKEVVAAIVGGAAVFRAKAVGIDGPQEVEGALVGILRGFVAEEGMKGDGP